MPTVVVPKEVPPKVGREADVAHYLLSRLPEGVCEEVGDTVLGRRDLLETIQIGRLEDVLNASSCARL